MKVVTLLNKEGVVNSFNKVLARVLKTYIPEGEEVTGETCDKCGSKDLAYMEGCKTCLSCAASKCG
jgi:ribonucleoside-diphosphate reductase alpha chain